MEHRGAGRHELHQRSHALVGRLADLRQRPGHAGPPAQRPCDGKLRVNADGTLPLDSKGVEDTGFKRNWWVGLSMLHTLFVREHNAICDHAARGLSGLGRQPPLQRGAADQRRRHGQDPLHRMDAGHSAQPRARHRAERELVRLADELLAAQGKARKTLSRRSRCATRAGRPRRQSRSTSTGCAFGLSEEFVEVYRLHSLLPETLALRRRGRDRSRGGGAVSRDAPVVARPRSRRVHAIADLFFSFGNAAPGRSSC